MTNNAETTHLQAVNSADCSSSNCRLHHRRDSRVPPDTTSHFEDNSYRLHSQNNSVEALESSCCWEQCGHRTTIYRWLAVDIMSLLVSSTSIHWRNAALLISLYESSLWSSEWTCRKWQPSDSSHKTHKLPVFTDSFSDCFQPTVPKFWL